MWSHRRSYLQARAPALRVYASSVLAGKLREDLCAHYQPGKYSRSVSIRELLCTSVEET